MKTKTSEQRCKACKKLLLDEKLPICPRCRLKYRDKTEYYLGIASGIAMTTMGIINLINNNDAGIDDNQNDSTF